MKDSSFPQCFEESKRSLLNVTNYNEINYSLPCTYCELRHIYQYVVSIQRNTYWYIKISGSWRKMHMLIVTS
jgi:hypothetical protein